MKLFPSDGRAGRRAAILMRRRGEHLVLVEAVANHRPFSGQPCRHGVDDFVELRASCAIAVQNEIKTQNKKAFVVVLALSGTNLHVDAESDRTILWSFILKISVCLDQGALVYGKR